jgi:hypothetical protein
MTTSREWHDLLLRKRFGFGHDLDSDPRDGDMALFCPACPQPGINIPSNISKHPPSATILSLLVVCSHDFVDGCIAETLLLMETSRWST